MYTKEEALEQIRETEDKLSQFDFSSDPEEKKAYDSLLRQLDKLKLSYERFDSYIELNNNIGKYAFILIKRREQTGRDYIHKLTEEELNKHRDYYDIFYSYALSAELINYTQLAAFYIVSVATGRKIDTEEEIISNDALQDRGIDQLVRAALALYADTRQGKTGLMSRARNDDEDAIKKFIKAYVYYSLFYSMRDSDKHTIPENAVSFTYLPEEMYSTICTFFREYFKEEVQPMPEHTEKPEAADAIASKFYNTLRNEIAAPTIQFRSNTGRAEQDPTTNTATLKMDKYIGKTLLSAPFTNITADVIDLSWIHYAKLSEEEKRSNPEIIVTLQEYRDIRRESKDAPLMPKEEAERQLINAAASITAHSYFFISRGSKEDPKALKFKPIAQYAEYDLERKHLVIKYDDEYNERALLHASITPIAIGTFRTSSKKPNAKLMSRCIQNHKRMNRGEPNEDIISVKTLLKAAMYIPTERQVKASNRDYSGRIWEPFERDLLEACRTLPLKEQKIKGTDETRKFIYCDSKGNQLEDTEEDFDYDKFKTAFCKFDWEVYPNTITKKQGKALKEKHIEEAKEKKKQKVRKQTDNNEEDEELKKLYPDLF